MNAQWLYLFKPLILERGREYYQDSRVKILQKSQDFVQAEVAGSDDYIVEIYLSNDKVVGMECNCPYAAGGEHCKHMAAVLYASALDAEENSGLRSQKTDTAIWIDALNSLPEDVLRNLLKEYAATNTELQERLVLLHMGKPQENAIMDWKTDLMEMVWEVADYDDFVSYRDAYSLMSDMVDYMLRRLDPLINCGAIMDAFHLVDTVFITATDIEMDDSDGGLYMLFSHCADAWKKIFRCASEEQHKEMHRLYWIGRECNSSEIGADERDDIFLNLPWEEELQKENLERLDREILLHKKRDYHFSVYLTQRENIMRRLGAGDSAVIAFWEQYRDLSEARERLLQLYSQFDKDAAIKLLLESKEIDKDTPYKQVQHSQKLIELYRECGQKEDYENELRFLVMDCKHIQLPYLQQLKEITEPLQWQELFESLLGFAKTWAERFTLLRLEERYQTMLEDIQRAGNIYWLNQYEEDLRRWSIEKTRDCYVALLKQEMQRATNRKQYWTVIQWLKRLKNYPEGKEMTEAIVQYWCRQHNNRSAMKDELRKARYI